jgi:hypothetical protein
MDIFFGQDSLWINASEDEAELTCKRLPNSLGDYFARPLVQQPKNSEVQPGLESSMLRFSRTEPYIIYETHPSHYHGEELDTTSQWLWPENKRNIASTST